MIRALAATVGIVVLAAAPSPCAAQQSGDGGTSPGVPRDRASWTRGVIHYGKWVTAGAAVGLTIMGAREHRHSTRAWDSLLTICRANNADCMVGTDGRYTNATAEYQYQLALYYDRRANRRLMAGQLSLLATAAMFIVDLRRGENGPENIPFAPLMVEPDALANGARVGVRFRF